MNNIYPIKILLVDDKAENLLAMESILENKNYDFQRAYSAKEALKILLKEEDFALILMDVNMPEMNGFDTARLIYNREKLAHIPIIFITANDYNEENIFRGYMSGGVDYIFKPINPDLLRVKVQVFIELYKKNRKLIQQEQKLKQINQDLEEKIKEKYLVEEELRLRNMQLSDAQKLTHIGSWEWNILNNKIKGSEEIYDIYEIDPSIQEINLDQLLEKVYPADLEATKMSLAQAISNDTSFDIYFRLLSSNGTIKHINKKGKTVSSSHNEAVNVFGTSQDITNLKKTERQLKIFNLLENMLNEIYIFRENDFKLLYANADALRNLGYATSELKDIHIADILKDYKKSVFKKMIAPLLNGSKDKIVFLGNFQKKSGRSYPVEIHLQLTEQEEKKVFLAVVLDLTERKRTEQVLAESLREKEILLKEIHHRVKNNLQIVYSLLNLQSGNVSDESVLAIFKESQSRIRSMALIHEKLYKHNNLSYIDFSEYLNDLLSSLAISYKVNKSVIDIRLDVPQIFLNIDISISLGLCVTELVTNCFKYAFPDKRQGKVDLCLELKNDNRLILIVKDDGVGLPPDFNFEANESLGLKLVSSLTEQHHGALTIHNGGATSFRIDIPVTKDSFARSIENFSKDDGTYEEEEKTVDNILRTSEQ